ncbi:hypothetical protein [Stygiolobus azoricus]|uniref:ParA family protein n=1 Tax=Stygiolobus azoricus TaxID=41675 RepID=A0A650CMK3_9CREN|nr:hypothetical protein [Stygiolobus azoricus]QGR19074.1 hypothetical protein D1868_03175 [Stygiolobus azoricus]
MKKRVRFLSSISKIGKSTFTVLTAYYLKSLEIPFLIEELDPFQTVRVLVDDEFDIVDYFNINKYLYSDYFLDVEKDKLQTMYNRSNWNMLVSDMLTNIDPHSDPIKFQNNITTANINVFLTDMTRLSETIEYAKKWDDGYRVLVVNMVPSENVSLVEDQVLDLIYEKGVFKRSFIFPYDERIKYLDPDKLEWFKEALSRILSLR